MGSEVVLEQSRVVEKRPIDIGEEKNDFCGSGCLSWRVRDISLHSCDGFDSADWNTSVLHTLDTTISGWTRKNWGFG